MKKALIRENLIFGLLLLDFLTPVQDRESTLSLSVQAATVPVEKYPQDNVGLPVLSSIIVLLRAFILVLK